MTKPLVIIWAYLLSWMSSALIHVVDSDVGSIRGLGDPSVLLSVSIVALLVLGPVLVCCAAYRRRRWRGFSIAVAAFAVGLGLVVVALGFGGGSFMGRVLALVGMSALFGLVLVIAALPTIWVARAGNEQATARI